MKAAATLANALWLADSTSASRRFARALADPRAAQECWLRAQLSRHARSDFGRSHDFASIRGIAEFSRLVPLSDYAAVEPFVRRIRRGERDVLACGPVTHLAPTSGSTGSRKLIPFSPSLQEGFLAAVAAWMVDLARQRPGLLLGPAYWSVSPLADDDERDSGGAVRVGFADDADYLGGVAARLVRRTLAVPAEIRHVRDGERFWSLTLLALLRQRDLRLISIWHPSFLDLLVGHAEPNWLALLDAIAGAGRSASARAAELRRIGPSDWPRWWPRLQVISCWGEQAAEAGWARLRRRLPQVLVQAKGLLATEAVVTIPLGSHKPLAVTSHLFEFLDEQGGVRRADELARGERYEVVVTNGGGLWRYRLGDVVECTGHVRATPSLAFLGRAGHVSDLRGEKLSEAFVAEALRTLWRDGSRPAYAALRGRDANGTAGYDLVVSDEALSSPPVAEWSERLDTLLCANPHYALARRLGQLDAPRVIPVAADVSQAELTAHPGRLGDLKPRILLIV